MNSLGYLSVTSSHTAIPLPPGEGRGGGILYRKEYGSISAEILTGFGSFSPFNHAAM